MERLYSSNTVSDSVRFFTGIEVEQTPAFGLKTLFVVGCLESNEISNALEDDINHIYFGANQSFDPVTESDPTNLLKWSQLVEHFLNKGYWCTLDFDVSYVDTVASYNLHNYNKFIAMISVKIPHCDKLNANTTVKIDDIGFNQTNRAVWCNKLRNLMLADAETTWDSYLNDTIIN